VGGKPPPEEIERRQTEARVAKREKMLAELQEQSARLLAAIHTGRMVVVDDKAFPVDVYLQGLEIAEGGELEDIDHAEADADEPREARQRRIAARWNELPPGKREELIKRAREILSKANPGRTLDQLELLAAMFPPGAVQLVEPEVWRDKVDELTAGEAPPLVLFDQYLEDYEQTGLELLEAYRDAAPGDRDPPAGIISNEVDRDGQLKGAPEGGPSEVPAGRLMMISKEHLQEDRLHEALALLRLTANLPDLSKAREHVVEGLTTDVAAAAGELARMPPRILEDLVYRSSAIEGAWEGETLARVIRLLVTESTRTREAGDTELKSVISRARLLSEHAAAKDDRSLAFAERLQRTENYVSGAWVNALQLPVENGDIFECGDGVEAAYYVLIAQPCDLVLRGNGVREAQECALLPIVLHANPKQTLLTEPLPTKPPAPLPEPAEVRLKKGLIVSLEMLDLCWFGDAGTTVIQDVEAVTDEPMLTPGMNERRRLLTERARLALAELNAAEDGTPLHRLLVERLSSGPGRLQHDRSAPQQWAFPLRRVARLARPQAEALLVRYSAAQARAAFDHDLTKLDS
jgi:hypothetical protein